MHLGISSHIPLVPQNDNVISYFLIKVIYFYFYFFKLITFVVFENISFFAFI